MKKQHPIISLWIRLFAVFLFISACSKDIAPESSNTDTNPDKTVYNKFVDLGKTEGSLTQINESDINGFTKGTYEIKNVPNEVLSSIKEGAVLLSSTENGSAVLVTKVLKSGGRISSNGDLTTKIEGLKVGLAHIIKSGSFKYSGFANRAKAQTNIKEVLPYTQGIDPAIKFIYDEKLDKRMADAVIKLGNNTFDVSIKDKVLINEGGAKLSLINTKFSITPTFDIWADYKPLSDEKKKEYYTKLKETGLINNVLNADDFVNMALGDIKKIGIVSYSDVDASMGVKLEYSGTSKQLISKSLPLFDYNSFAMIGYVPVKIKTSLSLVATYNTGVSLTSSYSVTSKNNMVLGGTYDFEAKAANSIKEFRNLTENTVDYQLKAKAKVKVYIQQKVEMYVLGILGPDMSIEPFIAAEMNYNNKNEDEEKSLGVYASSNLFFKTKLTAFGVDKLTYDIPQTVVEATEDNGAIPRHYLYKLPEKIEKIAGDNQAGKGFEQLPKAIQVKVTDLLFIPESKKPLPDIQVKFKAKNGGYVSKDIVKTNLDGIAEVYWTPSNPDAQGKAYLDAEILYTELKDNLAETPKIQTVTFVANVTKNENLIAYYPFNGNANDVTGNNNNGVVNGAILTTDRHGNPDKAYNFGGMDKMRYIKVANSASMALNKTISISLWYNLNSYFGMSGSTFVPNGTHTLISKTGGGSVNRGFYMTVTNENYETNEMKQSIGFWNVPSRADGSYSAGWHLIIMGSLSGANTENLHKWIHVVIVIEADEKIAIEKIFINGTLVNVIGPYSSASYLPIHYYDLTSANSQDLYIGAGWSSFMGLRLPFNGSIDDVRIYNRSLSNAEIMALSKE